MTAECDLFAGFAKRRLNTGGAEIFLRIAGSGPPLLPGATLAALLPCITAQGGAQ
jgi:hypothetical protein